MSDTGITFASPEGISPVAAYHHAALANGFLHIAGQIARDGDGNWIGGEDVGEQAQQIYRNIGTILAHFGAGPQNVVKIMVYMVPDQNWEDAARARRAFFGEHRPPHTGLVIAGLGGAEVKMEVEVIAYIPPQT